MAIFAKAATTSFVNDQTATRLMTNFYNRTQTTTIVFTFANLKSMPRNRFGSTVINFAQTATRAMTNVRNRNGSSAITFAQVATRVMNSLLLRSGASAITFAQVATRQRLMGRIGNTNILFTPTDSETKAKGLNGSSSINFSQTFVRNINKQTSGATGIHFDSGGLPFNLLVSRKVYFMYPPGGPTTSVVLDPPLCGEKDRIIVQTISRHSRNGNLYAYKRTPSYEVLGFEFENVKFIELESMKAFFRLTAGQEVLYVDQYNRQWLGIILTDPIEFVSMCKFFTCPIYGRYELYSTSLEFEGRLI